MASRLRPGVIHLIGCVATLAVALVLLNTGFPEVIRLVFPRAQGPVGVRGEAIDYLFLALVPVVVWLIPPVVRALGRATHHTHRFLLGRSGFYVRFPTPRTVRFRDTVVHALGPFAINLVVISEIEYYLSGAEAITFNRVLFSIPLLLLAGVVTSLLPGGWLVDALDLRLVNPAKGEIVREAAVFEGLLGPIGALALLVSFVTLAHSVGDSYEAGIVLLALWAARMFPPVLAAVSVYRILIEPDVLPGLRAWAEREGLPVTPSVESALAGLRPATQGVTESLRQLSSPGEPGKRTP
ncbi:MAG TPA: hypothetical protein VEY12_07250 [Thermoplasmata archaeon]|nr:hypothetical protein [Thermoplasmata archaeon]